MNIRLLAKAASQPLGADGMTDEGGRLSDHIRNVLTDEIASGTLPPGAALDEQQLADRFEASRTPVREALHQLAVSGLVEMRPRRGVVVTRMTPERIMETFETMAEIEATCVRFATYRMTPIERANLMELHRSSKALVDAGNLDAYDTFNREFHIGFYRATHNSFLVEQAVNIRLRLNAFRRTQLRQGDRMIQSHQEHDGVMRAITQGDGDKAARRMRAHMLNAASALGRFIELYGQNPAERG